MRYRLIVFDWDGTLVDSTAAIAECIRAAARDLGLAAPEPARAAHVIGLGLEESLRLALPELPPSRYDAFVAHYRRHFLACENRIRPFPGVPALLEELRAGGYRLAVATGKSRRGLERALAASGLAPYFAATRCADEVRPKPHPAMLLELMRALAEPPGATVMVGDTGHDLQMAAAAGVDAIAVESGAHPPETLRALSPRACLRDVGELPRWLASLG
ncbi:MAG: HAD-IA family hydrolase [Burkholderiales bacterium]|nr:HAD-IA family hydrolase [Burkholderiales bacterium]